MEINETLLQELAGNALVDFGGAWQAGLAVIGDRLGLYRTLATAPEPLTSYELAARTGTSERYVREWLRAQAAGSYVTYHPPAAEDGERYSMTPEQALLMAHEDSPAFMAGGFQTALGGLQAVPDLLDAFRTGDGIGWSDHDHDVFEGVARFYRPGYLHQLTTAWIPALDGVDAKLERGAHVADVGCGHGITTILMAQAYPRSSFVGFDLHEASVEAARERAVAAGVSDRVRFEVATAKTFAGTYDFITVFDCLHDLGDPVGAAAHIRSRLAPDGTWMIAEPFAGDRVEDNLNPLGRAFYAGSTFLCTPCALDQEGEVVLGAQAGEAAIEAVVRRGGLTRFRRAAETPVNLIFEAKP